MLPTRMLEPILAQHEVSEVLARIIGQKEHLLKELLPERALFLPAFSFSTQNFGCGVIRP